MEAIRIAFPRVGRGQRAFDRVYCFDIAQQDLLPRIFPGALVFPGRLLGNEIFTGVTNNFYTTNTRKFKFERDDTLTKSTVLEPDVELRRRVEKSLIVVPLLFGSVAGRVNTSRTKYLCNAGARYSRRTGVRSLGHEGGLILQGHTYTPICCACKHGLLSITGDCHWDTRECMNALVFEKPTTFAQAMRRYNAHVENEKHSTVKALADVGK